MRIVLLGPKGLRVSTNVERKILENLMKGPNIWAKRLKKRKSKTVLPTCRVVASVRYYNACHARPHTFAASREVNSGCWLSMQGGPLALFSVRYHPPTRSRAYKSICYDKTSCKKSKFILVNSCKLNSSLLLLQLQIIMQAPKLRVVPLLHSIVGLIRRGDRSGRQKGAKANLIVVSSMRMEKTKTNSQNSYLSHSST